MSKSVEKIVLQPSHVAAFNFIKKYMLKRVYAPEIAEIAVSIKLTERQTYRLIDDLVALKVISKEKRRKRSIKILKEIAA